VGRLDVRPGKIPSIFTENIVRVRVPETAHQSVSLLARPNKGLNSQRTGLVSSLSLSVSMIHSTAVDTIALPSTPHTVSDILLLQRMIQRPPTQLRN